MEFADAITELYQENIFQPVPVTAVGLARPWSEYTEADRQLLAKILQSVKLSPASVRLNTGWVAAADVNRVLLFGVNPLPEKITPYQVGRIGTTEVLWADDLPSLTDQNKKLLWTNLRILFGI